MPGDGISSLIFDMDNTLFDLVGAKMRACGRVSEHCRVGSAGELFSFFLRKAGGFEDPENIRDFLDHHGCYSEDVFQHCTEIYKREKLRDLAPYPGVRETLRLLADAGFRMALVTDAHLPDTCARLSHTGLAEFFDPVVTYEVTRAHKPSTLPFLSALLQLRATARETVLIGDSPVRDIAPGVILGMTTVYARYGDRFPRTGQDGGAHYAIDDFRDLAGILGLPLYDTGHGQVG
ncbi:MAG TPA: HAD family hydrolase [Methanoregulaceae archaeon]|nr:MAG: HAD family hydrolase [Methanolinea sp.]HON81726.1 HAD family hydrolase [Methanoregulaceae archaeon]HPD10467.1 HAD family hydrolase [Methanoregulaceae archaeon]HRT15486.1 HAD family hydrolase [Methanoregulaceae archaeon]HRU31124.1 HAD family hydrolase [Methanoregulaceae archaeon]